MARKNEAYRPYNPDAEKFLKELSELAKEQKDGRSSTEDADSPEFLEELRKLAAKNKNPAAKFLVAMVKTAEKGGVPEQHRPIVRKGKDNTKGKRDRDK